MSGTISTAGDRDPTWSEALTAYCRERMANYKVPRRFAIVQELPLNASGKVVKGRLRESIS
jgi:acyl-CoA synthetase (AMP-forming)/AMP-acid ligase II